MPFFSIIIPVYNAEQYLERCVQSIRRQTYEEYEVLLVDDGSKDDSKKICKKIEKYDQRFVFISKEHAGVSAARNYGIQKAKGKYLVFVDADDYVADVFLEHLYEAVCDERADVCFMGRHYIKKENVLEEHEVYHVRKNISQSQEFSKGEFLDMVTQEGNLMPGSMWLMTVNRAFVQKMQLSFDENLAWSEDSDFIYQVFTKAAIVKNCDYCGYFYFMENEKSASRKFSIKKLFGRMNVYVKWIQYFGESQRAKEDFSEGSRQRFCQQLLKDYCETLNIYTHAVMKKEERIQLLQRLKAEKDIWKNCTDRRYRDYVKFGVQGGARLQKLKTQIKQLIR